ncbi:MAG TPA: UDP-N-acetylglucosamine 2-epimerase (non-hydrolyzing) [Thermoanaerobaculia bacterium]|jgi:UDP-N-acetylglucosamine 2-epimerase (non-hydrolysing)
MAAIRSKILLLYGTRPEAIKMAPVVEALRRRPERFDLTVCTTAQHRGMLDQVERVFCLRPDVDLDLMRDDQALNDLAARALAAIDQVLGEREPDWLLVQGDTTTAMAGALAGFHRGVRVGHVEAGLRTGDLGAPFPEEANRRIADLLATACFAPTDRARRALLAEGVAAERIHVTGNTVVDALASAAARLPAAAPDPAPGGEVLVTVHRRESFGAPLAEIVAALAELAGAFREVRWIFPVHPNPNVRALAGRRLGGLPNFELHEPFDYLELVRRLRRARLVVTDSGGLQEEAPTFSKPVLVLREKTERPEGIAAGVARLVGTERGRIVAETSRLLTDREAYRSMASPGNPYGDGFAAERIIAVLAGCPFVPFVPDGAAACRG